MDSEINNTSVFKEFKSQDELIKYLKRPESDWNEEIGKYDFEQCVFNFEVHFGHLIREFEDYACFKNATFNGSVSFKDVTFRRLADFNGCSFKDVTSFQNSIFEDELNVSSFEGPVTFRNAKFQSSTFFWNHFYQKADFAYSTFTSTVDFSNATFENDASFNDVTFEGEAFFEEAEFKSKVNAWKMKFNKKASFKWANFRAKVNMSEITALDLMNLHGVNFEGNAYFYDSELNELDIEKTVIDKGVFFLGAKIQSSNRESFRIIKHEFIKQNNKIEALGYHSREMECLRLELKHAVKSVLHGSGKWDKLILNVNRWTNGYGLNPGLGISCTLGITILFFSIYWMSLETRPIHFLCQRRLKNQ